MQPDTTKEWFYSVGTTQQGPVEYSAIIAMARRGDLQPQRNKVWFEGLNDWIDCGEITGLFDRSSQNESRETGSFTFPDSFATGSGEKTLDESGQSAVEASYKSSYKAPFLKKISYAQFVWSAVLLVLWGMISLVITGVAAYYYSLNSTLGTPVLLGVLGVLLVLMGFMVWFFSLWVLVIRQAWKIIPPNTARTTPDRAVWFLFIPFFSVYWKFVAFLGWAEDYNRFVQQEGLVAAPRIQRDNYQAYVILSALGSLSMIPYIGALLGLASLASIIYFFIIFNEMIKVINFFEAEHQRVSIGNGLC